MACFRCGEPGADFGSSGVAYCCKCNREIDAERRTIQSREAQAFQNIFGLRAMRDTPKPKEGIKVSLDPDLVRSLRIYLAHGPPYNGDSEHFADMLERLFWALEDAVKDQKP